jgi:hypothetical protein
MKKFTITQINPNKFTLTSASVVIVSFLFDSNDFIILDLNGYYVNSSDQ